MIGIKHKDAFEICRSEGIMIHYMLDRTRLIIEFCIL